MPNRYITERQLAGLAKRLRKQAGKTRAQAAREMGVSQTSIFNAEESPELGLFKLRSRMIAAFSGYRIVGPLFMLKGK